MFQRFLLVILIASLTILYVAPDRVRAITYGFVDTNGTYSNVGAFIVQRPSDGHIFPICSGTLISGGVFLTAGHCTDFFNQSLAPLGFTAHVSFDSPIGFGDLTDLNATKTIPVLQVVTNPGFNRTQSDPGDLGVLLVSASDTVGVTPAALPSFGLLSQLADKNGLKDAVFTAVGYGEQNRIVGGGPPFFQDANPVPRMFAFSTFSALDKGYLRSSQNPATGNGGTCYGDSGGPNFLDVNGTRTLAAITITGDTPCRSRNVDYRLDTASARQFLASYVLLP
jgi:secreted trypsin-like serine protease